MKKTWTVPSILSLTNANEAQTTSKNTSTEGEGVADIGGIYYALGPAS